MTLLIFDCDGTLIDSELLHALAEVEVIQERLGLTYETVAFNRRFVGNTSKAIYDYLEAEFGKPLPADFQAAVTSHKQALFRSRLQPMANMLATIGALAAYPRCVASNTELETLDISLKTTGLYDLFAPNIFSAQMVKQGKPAPDLFLYAAHKMGVSPADCIVIEDSFAGVTAARAAGMRVFGFTGGSHCYPGYAERLAAAELTFDNMNQLPQLLPAA